MPSSPTDKDRRSSTPQVGSVDPVAELRGVAKHFPGVAAVEDVDLAIYPGTVHVVAGENGAGKSTLMKLLSQVERADRGTILIDGSPVHFAGPRHAQSLGVAMVYQEFALAPHLSVAENLFLGREPMLAGLGAGLINRRRERDAAGQLLERVGLSLDATRPAGTLSIAEQQLVEIAKALAIDAKILIMDEPTATLTEREIDELFSVIRGLRDRGIAVLYISHRLDEIFRVADMVTVMRDGRVVATRPAADLDEERLVRLMVGREITNLYPKRHVEAGPVVLRVRGLTRPGVIEDCSFEVRAGEVVGLAGLVGAGRTSLARTVFGADRARSGTVEVDGRPVRVASPRAAIAAGIGYLTEDRKREGLALQLPVDQNITLANLPSLGGLLRLRAERAVAQRRRDELDIRTPSLRRRVQLLSGGNQQKVVVAKWLETKARVLFFDEPARGVDVGAKAELFEIVGELAADGRAIVLISSYLPELINVCDRILVMREGRIAGELPRSEFSEEAIIALATGVNSMNCSTNHEVP
ncbi:MAG: ATP-binding cassette domain-containing protein [Streptosporangiales bacterium]|nr:ATP-binding cassette domain-containing protein [Streptosporangiales bacterium]